jgi:hypothetical protein
MMLDMMCASVLCFNKFYLGVAPAPFRGYVQEGWSADSEKVFAELGRCEHLFLYVIGAAGTSDDGQSVPAATSTHPKKL